MSIFNFLKSAGASNLDNASAGETPATPNPNANMPVTPSGVPNALASNKNSILSGKKPLPPIKKEYDFSSELKNLGNKPMKYDNNKTATQLIKEVSNENKINPKLLYSSSWIEGMNKAVASPDDVSEAYNTAVETGKLNQDEYPVDGFHNYGTDTFGDRYNELKKYLPAGFENRFKIFNGTNEKNQSIKTAAFKSNKDALIAKSAMLKAEQDNVLNYAKSKGINLDPDAADYFTMASYNGGFGGSKKMIDEYSKAKDKKSFIEKGETSQKGIHANVNKRMKIRQTADELLGMNKS